MMRLFIALKIPDLTKDYLSLSCLSGIPHAAFSHKSDLHITLRYIGNADESLIDEICLELNEFRTFKALSLTCDGLGVFGTKQRAKVLWVSIMESNPLLDLKNKIDKQIDQFGFARDKRRYRPHITLARMRKSAEKELSFFIQNKADYCCFDFKALEIALFNSNPIQKGPKYEELYSVRLTS